MERQGAVVATTRLTDDIFMLKLNVPEIAAGVQGGQFVHVSVPGFTLRRPFTVADVAGETITLIIRRAGRGTACLASLRAGATLALLGPLGTGFSPLPGQALLVGGGIGTAALTLLARRLQRCTLVMGGRTAEEFWLHHLDLPPGVMIRYATDDGSQGFHGNPVELCRQLLAPGLWVAACGPVPMLKGLQQVLAEHNIPGQFALEERMACGIGACMGCACETKKGPALVCKDGPVFPAQEVVLP